MIAVAAAVAVVAVGCGGTGGDGWAGRVATLPDLGTPATVTLVDLAAAAELAGVDATTDDGLLELIRPNEDVGVPFPETLDPVMLGEPAEFAATNGYDRTDVDWIVEVASPPAIVAVLEGRFDADRLDEANEPTGDGTWNTDANPAEMDLETIGPGRRLGRVPHLRLDGEQLTVAHLDLAAVDAGLERRDLGEDGPVAAIAGALDDVDAYAAQIAVGPGTGMDPEMFEELEEGLAELQEDTLIGSGGIFEVAPLPERFAAVAAGLTPDADRREVLLHAHASVDAAEANAEALTELLATGTDPMTGSPYADRYLDVEVEVRDTVTVTRFALPDGSDWMSVFQILHRDPLTRSR